MSEKEVVIDYLDTDVESVRAALGDACLAGGLSKGYYHAALEALSRLEERLKKAEDNQ